jgi:hypothetical protein
LAVNRHGHLIVPSSAKRIPRLLAGHGEELPNQGGDPSSELRQVVIVLRLVLSQPGRIHHGEVIDAESGVRRRFSGRDGMDPAVRWVLAHLVKAGTSAR